MSHHCTVHDEFLGPSQEKWTT